MYSKIPMPPFKWKEEDMADSLLFFPMVGIVIGAAVVVLNVVYPFVSIPVAVRILLTLLLPLIITGGFHADGFMDTEDALNSYAPSERKLEIMKDPHLGAFAVISLVKWLLAYAAALTAILLNEKCDPGILLILGITFVISRSLSGLGALLFRKAKKSGMLYEETKQKRTVVKVFLVAWLLLSAAAMIYLSPIHGGAVLLALLLHILYYRYKVYREFGGVTGDTAGYYLTTAEVISAVVLAVVIYLV